MKNPPSPDDQHIPYETLGRYLAGRIDRDERASVERHLQDCPYCRQDVADAQQWQTDASASPKPTLWQKLKNAFFRNSE